MCFSRSLIYTVVHCGITRNIKQHWMDELPGDRWLSQDNHRLNDLSIPQRLGGGSGGKSRIKVKQDSMGSRLERIKDLFLGLPQPSAFVKNRRQSGVAFVDLDAQVSSVHLLHFRNTKIFKHGSFKWECLVKEIPHLGSQTVNRSQSVTEDPGRGQWRADGRCSCARATFHRNNHTSKGPEDD